MRTHVFVPSFTGIEECQAVCAYAADVRALLRPNGPGRHYQHLGMLPAPPPAVDAWEARVRTLLGVSGHEQSRILPHYLSVNDVGAAIQPHTDRVDNGLPMIRFNVFAGEATGGEPVIENETVRVARGDAWYFNASSYRHWSNAVTAGTRVVLSFGYHMPSLHWWARHAAAIT